MSSLECKHDRLARACTECEAEQTIVDLNIVLDAYESALGMTVDALGFLQGTAPAAFLGRPLAEYAAHLIKELTASNARMREALKYLKRSITVTEHKLPFQLNKSKWLREIEAALEEPK